MRIIPLVVLLVFISCTNRIYIVRHAEKANPSAGMSSDVPLSPAGVERAIALQKKLKGKKIEEIYSTNTIRTKATAKPTADHFGLTVNIYEARPDTAFIYKMQRSRKNILIVGHSNTVDDLVNKITGLSDSPIPGDLPETQYDNLYILKRSGNHYQFQGKKYGAATQ